MPIVLTKKEYPIDDLLVIKDEKGQELFKMNIRITDNEVFEIRQMIDKAVKGEELDETDRINEIIFKDKLKEAIEKIGENQVTRVNDYVIGLITEKVGLDRMDILKSATMKLQKNMKK